MKSEAPCIDRNRPLLTVGDYTLRWICKRFHEKADLVKYCFLGPGHRFGRSPTNGRRDTPSNSSLLEMFLVFPDFAHRRLALLPFALLNWSISAPVPVGVLNL